MRDYITFHLHATVLQWAEWDGERETFAVIHRGRLIVADSLGLLLSALMEGEEETPFPLAA